MKTKNLKDLGKLKVHSPVRVAICKPGFSHTITKSEFNGSLLDHAANVVKRKYKFAIEFNKQKAISELKEFYRDETIRFADKHTSDAIFRIATLMEKTGKSCKEISADFTEFFGEDCSFFRKVGHNQIPINLDRILLAYIAIKDNKTKEEVKKILYE